MRIFLTIALALFFLFDVPPAQAGRTASPSLMGAFGLNTVPSARMAEQGTVRLNISTLDPYIHGNLGIQIADPFYIGIRQSAEFSDIHGDADRLLPGIDLRLRLIKESAHIPAVTVGMQSAFGHKRMAGEYLALSKRYKDFDFTAGMSWGRLGSAAHISNPLKALHEHFGKHRQLDSESPQEPNNWFTGEDVGFFGGIEYFTPYDGLSVKADWGADRFTAEQNMFDYDSPNPWAVGINYAPADWINLGAAFVGGKKLLGTLTLQSPMTLYPGRKHKNKKVHHMRAYRTGIGLPAEMAIAAARDDIRLYETNRDDLHNASTKLLLDPNRPSPMQLGRSARHMANHAGEAIEGLRITPLSYGLEGNQITLQRRDLEQALIRHQGSPQEIWRNLTFDQAAYGKGILHDRFNGFDVHTLKFVLQNDMSLSEEDSGLLYRTAFIIEESRKLSEHIWAGGSLRFDIKDNLHNLQKLRPRSPLPVRSNVDEFAQRTISLDRTYLAWMTTLKPDLHISLTGGLIEEMYAGLGGEILFRPFGKTFAIGAEAYEVFKRDPYQPLNLGFNGDRLLTGHLNLWYELPDTDLTLQARIGRYLAEDVGGTFAIHKQFDNGTKLEAFVTATDNADFDLFGSTTHLYSGMKFTLPIGNIKHVPEGSEIRVTAAPFGRDTGQALDTPVKLYDVSEPLSYRHLARNWNSVTK